MPALLDLARDNYLAQFVAGGRSRAEVAAIARPEPVEDSREARRKGEARRGREKGQGEGAGKRGPDEIKRARTRWRA